MNLEEAEVFIEGHSMDVFVLAKKTATFASKKLLKKLAKAYDQLTSVGKNPNDYHVEFVVKTSNSHRPYSTTATLLSQDEVDSLLTAISNGITRPY